MKKRKKQTENWKDEESRMKKKGGKANLGEQTERKNQRNEIWVKGKKNLSIYSFFFFQLILSHSCLAKELVRYRSVLFASGNWGQVEREKWKQTNKKQVQFWSGEGSDDYF